MLLGVVMFCADNQDLAGSTEDFRVKGRTSFAFSDVRRLIANAALSKDFLGLWPSPRNPRQNPFVSLLLRMVA